MASYFQSYFQTSSMPKRLLQYALSRLEILDTEALDLENLDIAWGKNSTFEFKDVGLRLRKLESLLQLPPSFELLKAQVLLLRLTIPVDIYNSPIVVEVDGVDCQLHVKEKNGAHRTPDRKRTKRSSGSGYPRSQRGPDFVDDAESTLPTAADLAQSFLQTEPKSERAELEAAMLSETQDFGSSSALSDDEDVEGFTGTGTALTLPAFMTRFLQGIVDRLAVKVHGVTVNLDIEVSNENARPPTGSTMDSVTVQLKIDQVDIEGVTHDLQTATSNAGEEISTKLIKEGKRLLHLSKIRGALITEANIFSSLARSSALSSRSSPSVTHSEVFDDRKTSKSYNSTRGSSTRHEDEASSPDRILNASSGRLSPVATAQSISGFRSMHDSAISSDRGRFEDAPEEDLEKSTIANSDLGDSIFQNSAYLDQITESRFNEGLSGYEESSPAINPENTRSQSRLKSPLTTPKASVNMHIQSSPESEIEHFASQEDEASISMLKSTILPSRPSPELSRGSLSTSQPYLTLSTQSMRSLNIAGELAVDSNEDSEGSDGYDSSTPVGGEDLSQSQLFSHEDAESMYMSAVSHRSNISALPGSWQDSDALKLASRTPIPPNTNAESLDNLKHAHHISPLQSPSASLRNFSPVLQLGSSKRTTSTSPPPIVAATQQQRAIHKDSSSVSERSTTSSEEITRLSKHIFDLDQVAIYLPASRQQVVENDMQDEVDVRLGSTVYGSDSRTAFGNIPGAFSTHLPPRSSLPTPEAQTTFPGSANTDASIEVVIGKVLTHFDISVGRLIWKLVGRVLDALKSESMSSDKQAPVTGQPDVDIKISAEDVCVQFLERLEGTSVTGRSATEYIPWNKAPDGAVLLRTNVEGYLLERRTSQQVTETAIQIGKFVIGYAVESILSFDADLQMRASVRDLKASAGLDVSIIVKQTHDTTHVELKTLPIHISIDLQRLDETFSWFGGLSSVLNLGSSIASNATVTTANIPKSKPRSVRFANTSTPGMGSPAVRNKTEARIGGLVLDLVGENCSVGVETSAIKLVSRDTAIAASIQKIRLSGPHLRTSIDDPAIIIDVMGTRVDFLSTPHDSDLDMLLSLITPSKAKYDQDDDILLDTLLRQRKQGSVLRLVIEDIQTRIGRLDELSHLPELGEEVSRLSTVAKYLPDDDRPGLLSLIKVKKFDLHLDIGRSVGTVHLASQNIEVAQITLPSLVACSVSTLAVRRNGKEDILGPATNLEPHDASEKTPAIMARIIGDEMEPVVKIKLWNLQAHYRVSTLIALLGLTETATPSEISASLTASVVTLTGRHSSPSNIASRNKFQTTKSRHSLSKPMTIDIVLRDCILGLNPLSLPSQVLVVLTDSHISTILPHNGLASATGDISKASILVIDNIENITFNPPSARSRQHAFDSSSKQVAELCAMGFVSVSYISSANAVVKVVNSTDGDSSIDVVLRDDLFVLESCADSTQTLIAVLAGLIPPAPPPGKETKYRTKVIPVEDLLASLSGDAFGTAEGAYNFDDDFGVSDLGDTHDDDDPDDFDLDSHYYRNADSQYQEAIMEDQGSTQLSIQDTHDGILLDSLIDGIKSNEELEELNFQENHFGTGSELEGAAHTWNSAKNTYDEANTAKVRKSPLRVSVRDVHLIWNLFDGYDWQHTRDTISKAVQDVEVKAIERRARNERRPTFDMDIEDEDTVIGDFLFNSIYIGVPGNRDPRELAAAINQELNDGATDTESLATTTLSASPSRLGTPRRGTSRKLRLKRSKRHKITFELKGVCLDLVVFPPGSGETQSSVDVRVHDFMIFDHIPTSTWKMFATYMQEAGERETGASMIHIELLNVKPVPELAASEIVLKATILPLRLHVDQDALDFITRFFEFKDDSEPVHAPPGDAPFLQRVEVNSVQVKLDFKPKRVDYAGLRSGHTTEFMNFLILDEADMTLRHTIIYGISGFDKLGKTLNDIWMPDIKRNQLPGILAGLAPVRSLVNVGGGLRHLVVVPMREYKKDGRIVRGISKGATAFAKTTGTELVKLGAKVAIGVQTVLQGAESLLAPTDAASTSTEEDEHDEDKKQISLYANQPVGVLQGLRGGYAGLQRDLLLARDAIIAVPGEVMEGGNAAGVLKAVRKHAPTVILRPAIGVAKAGGQILMGATNSLDPVNLQKADAKYKKH